jgi:hypothetical protein
MIEVKRSDSSPTQKIAFMGYANQIGAKVTVADNPAKYDEWCRKAREVGRELRLNPRVGDGV